MKSAPRLRIVNLEKKTAEIDEPDTYAADLDDSAGQRDFDAQLLQETATLEVQVPRGLRTHGSTAIAGQLRNGSVNTVPVPTKTYEVTVEPGANERKPKDFFREYWRPFSEFEFDMLQSREDAPELNAALDPRFCFRRERQSNFQTTRRFPALVSPRILPAWRRADPGPSPAAGRKAKTGVRGRRGATNARFWASTKAPQSSRSSSRSSDRIHTETASKAVKKKVKREFDDETQHWLPAGAAPAHVRAPSLFDDEYDAPRKAIREEVAKSKEHWVAEEHMLPTSRQRSNSAEEHEFQSRVIRYYGRLKNEALKVRYQQKLLHYRKEDGHNLRRSFDIIDRFNRPPEDEAPPQINREMTKSPDPVSFFGAHIKGLFNTVAVEQATPVSESPLPMRPRSSRRQRTLEAPRMMGRSGTLAVPGMSSMAPSRDISRCATPVNSPPKSPAKFGPTISLNVLGVHGFQPSESLPKQKDRDRFRSEQPPPNWQKDKSRYASNILM